MLQVVQDYVCVLGHTAGEDADLVQLRHLLQELEQVWPDQELPLVVIGRGAHLIMDESLIQVQDQRVRLLGLMVQVG